MRCYTVQFFVQLVSQFCCDTTAREIAGCNTIIKSRNIFVTANIIRSRIKFYFSQRLWETLQRIFEALYSVTPILQVVSQCFVRWSANKNTPSTLTSSPEGQVERQFARNIAVCNTSAHELQQSIFSRCDTSCTKNSIV